MSEEDIKKAKAKKQKASKNRKRRKEKKQKKRLLRSYGLKEIKHKIGKGRYERKGIKSKSKRIEDNLHSAINKIIIQDFWKISPNELNLQYDKLLSKSIPDKEIRDIFIHEENMQKIKHRIETKIRILDLNGKLLGTANAGGGKTLLETRNQIGSLHEGRNIEETDWMKDVRNQGYETSEYATKGNIGRVELTLIFRVGNK